jgi:uncharacterized delta-60 repeat protein
MKKCYFFAFVLLIADTAYSQVLIPDSIYGMNSLQRIVTPYSETFTKFLLQPDGMIISAGYDYDISQNDFHIDMARFDQCGMIDSTFGAGGVSRVKFEQRNTGLGFTLQPDGKILSVGQQAPSNAGSQQIPYVARFLSDGNPDTTFGTAGSNSLRFDPVSSGSFSSVHVLPDGRIVCLGNSTGNINGGANAAGVMRFLTDGSLDTSFNGTGKATYTGLNTSFNRSQGYVLQNGNNIVTGNYYDASFLQHFFAVAIDSSGALDTTWATGGVYTHGANLSGPFATAIQTDEKIILAAQRDPASDGIIVIRLNVDGTVDSTFASSGEASIANSAMTLSNVKVLSSGKIIVMGGYSQGFGIGCAQMLNSDGSTDSAFAVNGFMLVDLNNSSGTHNLGDMLELNGNRLLAGGAAGDFLSARYIVNSNVPHISLLNPSLSSTGSGTFQWYLDSILIPGATSSTYDPLLNGSYTVEITDDLGCTYMSDPFIIVSAGINGNSIAGVKIYPNPFNDELIIANDGAGELYILMTDAAGKIVYREDALNKIKTGISTSNIDPGVYMLTLTNGQKTCTVKLVK